VGVVSRSDLLVCLDVLGCESTGQTLDRYLSILQSVEFVQMHLRGNQTFYVRDSSTAFIRYAYREGVQSSDTDRNQALVRDSLDPVRKAVLHRVLGKRGSNV
jgi:hypothetical protein